MNPAAPTSSVPAALGAGTRLGRISLTVRDLYRSRQFYEDVLGLRADDDGSGSLLLSAPGGEVLIELWEDSAALPLVRRATGLYHLALLVPERAALAQALLRLARARWPLDGASDHLVSEALYLSDPDGNGIEIYRDRPRSEWPRQDGQLAMATLPLDLEGLSEALPQADAAAAHMAPATRLGHVHLQVADLGPSETFYHDLLGLDVTVRLYPGALFLSAGGYHHHIGLNTWHSAGAAPPPAGSLGLRHFEIVLSEDDLERVIHRLRSAQAQLHPAAEDGSAAVSSAPVATRVRDPSGNAILLRGETAPS